MNRLILRYEYDPSHFDKKLAPDDFGRLSLAVETERFSGRAGFWVQWQDIVELGESLSAYPIDRNQPLTAQWGFDMQEDDDLIIGIAIVPKNDLGELALNLELADEDEPWQRLRASFRVGYPALDLFRRDIDRLMASEIEEAILMGH